MQRRASGSAVSGEPAEARRLAPPDCFALRLRDLALPPCPAYVAAARASFLDFAAILPIDPCRSARAWTASSRKTSKPWPAISYPHAVFSRFGVLPFRFTSSFSIHSFVVPTPRVGLIHSSLTRSRARANFIVDKMYTLRVRDCPSFIYLPLQAARVYGFYWAPSRHVTCAVLGIVRHWSNWRTTGIASAFLRRWVLQWSSSLCESFEFNNY